MTQDMTDDEREAYQERVAICMFDGRLSQPQAEAMAWRQVLAMRERHERENGQNVFL